MKKILVLFSAFVLSALIWAQAPNKFTYQAVVRDAGGNLVANDNVGFRVSLLQGSASGPSVYTETQTPLTNANGLATFEIGSGVIVSGSIATIDWSAGPYFIKTEVDPAGGTSYSIVSTHQILSVPYALYANEADHAAVADSVVGGTSAPFTRTYLYAEKKATIQSVTTGTNTTITNYDSYSASGITFNTTTGTVTFNNAGIYMMTIHTSFNAINTGRKLVWLNCTSANWPVRIASNEMSGDANRITTTFLGEFNQGDQLTLGVAQFTGITVDCPNNTQVYDKTWINIEKICNP